MQKTVYRFEACKSLSDSYFFFIDGSLRLTFSRSTLRDSFEALSIELGFSSHWVGSMLKIFRKKFPLLMNKPVRTDLDRLIASLGPEGIADHFRSRGFRAVKRLGVPDRVLLRYLESEGYDLCGVLDNDVLYSTVPEVVK